MRLKLLKFGSVMVFTLALFFCFSFSAFAADVDFILPSYPTGNLVNTTQKQSYSVVWQNPLGDYYYGEFVFDRNRASYLFGTNFFLSPLVVNNVSDTSYQVTSSSYFLLPCIQGVDLPSDSNFFNMEFKGFVYRPDGTLVSSTSQYSFTPSIYPSPPFTFGQLFFGIEASNTNFNNSCLLADGYRFFIIDDNTFPITQVTNFGSHSPSRFNVCVDSSYRNYVNNAWDGTQVSCSIPDKIYINDVLVYDPGSSDDGNLASKIIGSAIGSISFPDGNGGTTTADVNVNVDLDMPEYDGDIGTDEFPTMPEFDDSALSVIDGGSALQWVYARVNDLVTTNQKIFALVTSCLSLGVIMLILNKRS